MSQYDFGLMDPNTKTGTQLATDLNQLRDALNSLHRGAERPEYVKGGMLWVREVSADRWDLLLFDGVTDVALRSIDPTTHKPLAIPVASGGTGASTAAGARTALGVDSATLDQRYLQIENAQAVPTGAVVAFAMPAPPDGFLKANGAAASRDSYASLFAVIGTTHGAGNGSTTFNLPDMRGEFLRGWDDGRGLDGGRALGSIQGDELKSHSHSGSANAAGNHRHGTGLYTSVSSANNPSAAPGDGYIEQNTDYAGNHGHSLSINATGGNETRPRNLALLYCIKY